ncbi:MAG: O-antigen ligase family protein [Chromatiales bacterium]|nr:O-antigen ligase family protein [Chromatiales bacterium]
MEQAATPRRGIAIGRAAPAAMAAYRDQVSTLCFLAYLLFLLSFFLRFSARIPGLGAWRPTLVMIALVSLLLVIQRIDLTERFKDPVFRVIALLVLYILLSIPFVQWPGSVLRHNLSPFISVIVFFFFTALIVDSERRLKITLLVFTGCQLFRILEPLYLNITTGYWGDSTYLGGREYADRLAGAPADVINANELGFVIVTAIPFLHFLLAKSGWKGFVLYLALMPALLYALLLTMSRGAFLALLVVLIYILIYSTRRIWILAMLAVLGAAGLSVSSDVQRDRYRSLISDDAPMRSSVDGRLDGAMAEMRLGFNRPLFGHGLGTTPEAKVNIAGRRPQASHNLYGELLIELGTIGFTIFLIFLLRMWRAFRDNSRTFQSLSVPDDHFYARLNHTLTALLVMYAFYSVNYWGLSQYYWYFFGGLVVAFGRILRIELADAQAAGGREAELATPQKPGAF